MRATVRVRLRGGVRVRVRVRVGVGVRVMVGVRVNGVSAPSERPIQFSCAVLVPSGHSTPQASRSSASRSAYAVIFRTHWRSGWRTTGKPPG